MNAEILRRAAALMRERAEAATPGPWTVPGPDDEYVGPADVVGDGEPGSRYIICEHAGSDAKYIASWHPAVAEQVAIWLEKTAAGIERRGVTARITPAENAAIDLARIYLGKSA